MIEWPFLYEGDISNLRQDDVSAENVIMLNSRVGDPFGQSPPFQSSSL